MENLDVNQYLCLNNTEHGNNFNNILLAIAQEIQSCSNHENISGNRNIFLKITKYKASITNKKYKINYLNQTIRILLGILKFLLKRKDKEDLAIKSQEEFSNTRFIEKFINKGYETLTKTLKEPLSPDITVLHKIKKIFACTHKYYSYLENIRTKYSYLEQKNRFLQNKIIILESHLNSLIKENNDLHCQILRSKRENITFKQKNVLINTAYKGNELDKTKKNNSFEFIKYPALIQMDNNNLSKLRAHISLINGLLSYQKEMLQDAEEFSKKIETK